MARDPISISNWNACSLKSKAIEFVDFLNENSIDVAIITETHLKPEVNVFLPDFRLMRLDRTSSEGGGVAIAIRKNICCRLLPSFNLKTIEAIGVEITTSSGPLTIIAAYCPNQVSINNGSAADLRADLKKLTRRREKFIIGGDLNAKHQAWGNSRRNRNGSILSDDHQEAQYTILAPDSPTRLGRSGAHATIDIFITNMANVSEPVVHQELSSDHYPVVVEVGSSANRFQATRRNYHRDDWDQFRQCVDSAIVYDVLPESTEDIDRCLGVVEAAISRAREQHVPAARQVW